MNTQNQNSGSGQSGSIYFMLGALVVAVLVIGYFVFGDNLTGSTSRTQVDVEVGTPSTDNNSQPTDTGEQSEPAEQTEQPDQSQDTNNQ